MATNYFSPWDIWYNRGADFIGLQPSYVITNGDVDGNFSPYVLKVHAWVGLAYFDGKNDGIFEDHHTQNTFAINNGGYPNLFANGEEVGNLVKTTISTLFQPQEGARIEDMEDHLPMPGGTDPRYLNTPPPYNWAAWANGFDDGGILQPMELLLLRDYGKVFFYEVDVFEAATNAFVGTYILHPEIQTLPQGTNKKWHPVPNVLGTAQAQGSLSFGSFNLHYYTDTSFNPTVYDNTSGGSGKCNSFELVFDAAGIKHEQTITGSVPKKLSMEIWQDVPTFWQRSTLHLRVH
ncbi:hypothetical protein P3875_09205 [Myroides sp. JBRI-B21084]|uniref:hypothetical protein n=1 Tax=Myroides sp. JBRI-B21084 TaxID=3119977 RepID=UPI0026E29668|nr:hypothetical protein [Paenimyroides cloacae]WKW45954.1 hypothetical protein P3875_09205 [Paenimyroides cloacae]